MQFNMETELPIVIKVLNYNPGCEGSPKMGPPRSYQDIQAPEDEEVEFEVYIDKQKIDLPDEIYNSIYEDVLEKTRELYQEEKERMRELKAEQKIEELQEKRML